MRYIPGVPVPQNNGLLYLVATPLGNLADLSQRAVDVLRSVAVIAAEDTRHSRPLLLHYGIDTPLIAYHEHNENAVAPQLLARLQQGESVALISDAGTPLISDPGFPLVRLARAAGIQVTPIPGPCALIAALSASGLPCDHFYFGGFLPRKSEARRSALKALDERSETLVFYESSHRVLDCLQDMAAVLPAERPLCIAREISKHYETIVTTTVAQACALVEQDANMQKGEFVLVVQGQRETVMEDLSAEQRRVLNILLAGGCTVKSAAAMAAEITGAPRKACYQAALQAGQDLQG
ncbi:MAG: 16S rRNA (cytidine(1402)-2'-O)-methyltransferase [Methylococcaceae bacterium]|nr:MAG: 16S rRNA (cytidine(1402)-2'-O)-methyltransferase [Methylococcaceae bacterium]